MADRFVEAVIGPKIDNQVFSTSVRLGDPVYWDSGNSRWEQADASDATKPTQFICVGLHSFGANPRGNIALGAIVRDDDGPFTANAVQYLSETAGAYTETAPTTAGSVVQALGRAVSASRLAIHVQPQLGAGLQTAVPLHLYAGASGASGDGSDVLLIESDGSARVKILTPSDEIGAYSFGSPAGSNRAFIQYNHAADVMQFAVSGSVRLNYSAGAFAFQEATTISTSTGTLTLTPATDVLISNGKGLVVGHTAQVGVGATGEFQVLGTAAEDSTGILARFSADAGGPTVRFGKSRGATIGSTTIVESDDVLGSIIAYGADGNDILTPGAQILFIVDGTPGLDDMPGRIVFSTTADGTNSVTERLRITSAGVHQMTQSTDDTFFQTFRSDSTVGAGFKLIRKVYDKDSALFDAAGTTDTVEVYAANPDTMVLAAWAVLDTQFVLNGDRTTLVVTLGEDGVDIDDVLAAGSMNLASDAAATKYKTRGALWAADEAPVITNRVIDATATLSGGSTGNLASMSAGQITVYLLVLDWS